MSLVIPLLVALAPVSTRADVVQLPDLVALPPSQVHVGIADDAFAGGWDPWNLPTALRFAVSMENAGAYALELRGVPEDPGTFDPTSERRPAWQCVWFISRVCRHTTQAGQFVWHREHGHWHIADYATYELRRVDEDQLVPDMSEQGLLMQAAKVSFCLIDSKQSASSPPGYDPLATVPIFQTCNDLVEGISPGWMDVYDAELYGQQFPVKDLSDGLYAIVVDVNPSQVLLETDYSDNLAWAVVALTEDRTKAEVVATSR